MQAAGKQMVAAEENFLANVLCQERYLKHTLLIGVPAQRTLLKHSSTFYQTIIGPIHFSSKQIQYIESDLRNLPIIPGGIDVVLLPHTLDFTDNPHQLLIEACRSVKPEGDIVIFCFNKYSLWGLKKWWVNGKKIPWSGNFLSPALIKKWLSLADFELTKQTSLLLLPPSESYRWSTQVTLFKWLGLKLGPLLGGVTVITAKAKVIPLTPIKLRWKQKIPPLRVTMPGATMRDMR